MRRPPIPLVTVLLLAAATAGCTSSDSPSSASSASSATVGAQDASGADAGTGTESSGVAEGSDGAEADGSGGNGSSGSSGSSSNGGSGDGGSSSPAGVLFGADELPSPAADRCLTKNLKAAARSTGQGSATIVITNKGDGSCTVQGFASLVFVTEAGRTELPVDWAGSVSNAEKLDLDPGDSASAAVTFTSLDECDAVSGLDVVPPGESRPLTPAFTTAGGKKQAVRVCDTGVRLKEFTASR